MSLLSFLLILMIHTTISTPVTNKKRPKSKDVKGTYFNKPNNLTLYICKQKDYRMYYTIFTPTYLQSFGYFNLKDNINKNKVFSFFDFELKTLNNGSIFETNTIQNNQIIYDESKIYNQTILIKYKINKIMYEYLFIKDNMNGINHELLNGYQCGMPFNKNVGKIDKIKKKNKIVFEDDRRVIIVNIANGKSVDGCMFEYHRDMNIEGNFEVRNIEIKWFGGLYIGRYVDESKGKCVIVGVRVSKEYLLVSYNCKNGNGEYWLMNKLKKSKFDKCPSIDKQEI